MLREYLLVVFLRFAVVANLATAVKADEYLLGFFALVCSAASWVWADLAMDDRRQDEEDTAGR